MDRRKRTLALAALVVALAVAGGCAAGTERFDHNPAGFWAGLWHGIICVITFIISLFSDTVRMYEPFNTGALYDLGFLIGALFIMGSGWGPFRKRKKVKVSFEKDADEIAARVEEKVRSGIRKWVDEAEEKDKEWEEIGRKIEEKIKRELRDWMKD
jgi:hypothetical protein